MWTLFVGGEAPLRSEDDMFDRKLGNKIEKPSSKVLLKELANFYGVRSK